jgi:uncharacterized repeat protein (TIGR03803 family)
MLLQFTPNARRLAKLLRVRTRAARGSARMRPLGSGRSNAQFTKASFQLESRQTNSPKERGVAMKMMKRFVPLAVALALTAGNLSAQVFTLLHSFSATTGTTNLDGAEPRADLLLSGNMLYGTTPIGGTNGYGTIFSVNTNGSNFTVLHTFTGVSDGAMPNKALVLAGNTLYGLVGRGTNLVGYGSVFSMETNGSNFSLFYTFTSLANGSIAQPNGGMILSGSTLYGTTYDGGISNSGTIFSVTTNGTFNLLHQFVSGTDGANPLGTLVMSGTVLYGTARNGGTNFNFGTVFSLDTSDNSFAVLHTFAGSTNLSAHSPDAGMVLIGNTLYGTATFGGTNGGGTVFAINTDGSGYTDLHAFNPAIGEGKLPEGGLAARGNTLYGTTLGNGSNLNGTVYSVNTEGSSFTMLHAFSADASDTNADGSQPYGTLTMAGNMLYGTTSVGGTTTQGTVFSVAILPEITGINLAGNNLVLNAVNGLANGTYSVLASANLTSPFSEWTPITTNVLSGGGNFTIIAINAVNLATRSQFYTLRMQP